MADALSALKGSLDAASPTTLRDVSTRLRKLRLQNDARGRESEDLADALERTADAHERTARTVLLDDLRRSAEAAGQPFRRLGDDPLEVAIGPLEVSIPETGEATVRLGREPITSVEPRGNTIVTACGDAVRRLKADLLPAAHFFDLLHRAWRMVMAARGPSPDGRVDLVDLRLPLALLELGPDQWRKGRAERGVSPWPRYRLAYQLYRLRREGHLEANGVRVELAAATLSTTRDSRNVLHVLSGEGRGQFYGAIRFVPLRTAAEAPDADLRSPADPAPASGGTEAPSAEAPGAQETAAAEGRLDQVLDLFDP